MKKLVVAAALCAAVLPRMAMGATVALERDFAPLGPGVRAVDYIESNGKQFIDTGVQMHSQMNVEIDFAFKEFKTDGSHYAIFGSRNSNFDFFVYQTKDSLLIQHSSSERGEVALGKFSIDTRYRVIMRPDRKRISSGGNTIWSRGDTPGSSLTFADRTAYAFGANVDGGISRLPIRLYGLKIKDDSTGAVVRHYVPCVKDGVAGLYDGVTGAFFGPQCDAKSGGDETAFACGSFIEDETNVDKPREIARVNVGELESGESCTVKTVSAAVDMEGDDYLESDGTQDIDLGIKLSSDMIVDLDFAPLQVVDDREGFFGFRKGSGGYNGVCVVQYTDSGSKKISADSGSSSCRAATSSWGCGERIVAHLESRLARLTDAVTGTELAKNTSSAGFGTESNVHLFKAPGFTDTCGVMRFYSLTISEKESGTVTNVLHRFVPAAQDGVVGVFDEVGNAGFLAPTNNGAHSLSYSFETYGSKLWKKAPEVEVGDPWLMSDGSQYFDFDFELTKDMKVDLDFEPLEKASGNYGYFGQRAGAGVDNSMMVIYLSDGWNVAIDFHGGETPYRQGYGGWSVGQRLLAHIESGNSYFADGETDDENQTNVLSKILTTKVSSMSSNKARLFGANGFSDNTYAKMKFYSLKITEGSGVVCHFVPYVQDGVAGIYDIEGDKGFIPPSGTGSLVYGVAKTKQPLHVATNEFTVAENGTVTLTAFNLKPGISYVNEVFFGGKKIGGSWYASQGELYPDESLMFGLDLPSAQPPKGKLAVTLTRIGAGAETVTVLYGTADGGDDPKAWENQKTLSKGFAAGVSTLTAKVALPAGTTFVRFMTSGGSWSSTVYLPETQFEPGGTGLVIILR